MRVVVSGASGLIGRAFVRAAEGQGHEVLRLVRRPDAGPSEVSWDPERGRIDSAAMAGARAVVHLAGENIAGRWTYAKMLRILDSRTRCTRLLAESMGRLNDPPRVFVSASATGFYGNRGDELLTERSAPGIGFLPDVCRDWEAAAWPAAQHRARVVNARFGMVLSQEGGALAAMLPAFRLGLGAVLGSGRQYTPWVAIEDAVAAILFAIADESVSGAVNVVAPGIVTNRTFTKTLAGVLGRRAFLKAPAFALRLVLRQMADEVLLASANARPERLMEAGFKFTWPDLERALAYLLRGVDPKTWDL